MPWDSHKLIGGNDPKDWTVFRQQPSISSINDMVYNSSSYKSNVKLSEVFTLYSLALPMR